MKEMNEFKEVWYVWDGVGEPPNQFEMVALASGLCGDFIKQVKYDWSIIGHSTDIVAYTLGEKRRRCVACDGKGKWKENCWFTRVCQTCNGIGWEYKK